MCSAVDQDVQRAENVMASVNALSDDYRPLSSSDEWVEQNDKFVSMGCDEALSGCRRTADSDTRENFVGVLYTTYTNVEWFCDGEFIVPCEQIGPIDFEILERTWVCP